MQQNPYQSPQEPAPAPRAGLLGRDIQLHGSMPLQDVIDTQWIILRRRWPWALASLGVYALLVFTLGQMNWVLLFMGLVVAPALTPVTLLLVYLRLREESRRQRGLFAVTESRLNEQGITARLNDEQTFVPWSKFGTFSVSNRVILLFLQDSHNHLIVSRSKLVHPEDWPKLVDFLGELLPER